MSIENMVKSFQSVHMVDLEEETETRSGYKGVSNICIFVVTYICNMLTAI